jgi:polygalacturonase
MTYIKKITGRAHFVFLAMLLCWNSVHGSVLLPNINTNNIAVVTNAAYGAVGDGVFTNTTTIQNAINAMAAGGLTNGLRGGVVEIPSGTFICGPLTIKNNVGLQLDAGAIVRLLSYNSYPGAPSSVASFITGSGNTNIAITGLGIFDGQGSPWWPGYKTNSRPVILSLSGCSRLLLQDFTITNPPTAHIAIKGNGGNVSIIGIKLFAPPSEDPVNPSHNTDGVDFAETNALFQDCIISTGDDNIALGSSSSVTKDILVTNCFFGEGHGCSIGSFTTDGVSNLTVINCTFSNTDSGIRIKSQRDRGGLVQNLNYYNLTMTNVGTAVTIISYYEFGLGTLDVLTPQFVANYGFTNLNSSWSPFHPPIFQNITISNLTATLTTSGPGPFLLMGLPDYPINNIVFKKMSLTTSSAYKPQIYNTTNLQFIDCSWNLSSISKIQFWDASATFTNSSLSTNLLNLDGLTTNGIGNTLEFDNAQATISNTNAIAGGAITLNNSLFTVNNNLSLSGAMPLNYLVGTNPATLVVKGSLKSGGLVNVIAGSGFTNGTYTLITNTGSLSGNLPSLGTTPPGYVCFLSNNISGQINLIVMPPPPGVPANLTASATNLAVNLNWLSASNAASYNLKRSLMDSGPYDLLTNLTATNYLDSAVMPGTTYYYVVTATNATAESANSVQAAAAPLPSSVSTNLSFQINDDQLQLTWPQDHLGWRLQVQTNDLASGIGTSWVTVPNSTNTTSLSFSIDPLNGATFFRLIYP